ncbi:TPA: hypothetical protein ACH3X2_008453 [Trebouxia sp. C0005]
MNKRARVGPITAGHGAAKEVAEAVLGHSPPAPAAAAHGGPQQRKKGQIAKPQIEYHDLEMHRIVGTGQFGMVRVVRHIPTNQAYALKVMHEGAHTTLRASRVEHVLNEAQDSGGGHASHPFLCGTASGPTQDKPCPLPPAANGLEVKCPSSAP